MSWRTTTDHSSAIPVGQLALRSPLLPSLPSLLPLLPSLPSVLFASSALLRTNEPVHAEAVQPVHEELEDEREDAEQHDLVLQLEVQVVQPGRVAVRVERDLVERRLHHDRDDDEREEEQPNCVALDAGEVGAEAARHAAALSELPRRWPPAASDRSDQLRESRLVVAARHERRRDAAGSEARPSRVLDENFIIYQPYDGRCSALT